MEAVNALSELYSSYRQGNQTNVSIVHHLREMDAFISRVQIKTNNLYQLKVELRKDMDWLIHQFLMPAQSDEDIASVDIFNIPDEVEDDPLSIVSAIGVIIGFPVLSSEIRGYYRAKIKRKNSEEPLPTRALVVRFYKVKTKWNFLRAYRRHITVRIDANTQERLSLRKRNNHLLLKHVLSPQTVRQISFEQGKFIFIDDHIGPFVRRLYVKVSRHCNMISIPYVWINNSKIYIRKKKSDPAIRIKKFSNILMVNKLIKKYTRASTLWQNRMRP